MYEIEKGIPMPGKGRRNAYPFHQMEVGDSFVTDSRGVQSAAHHHGRKYNAKFTVRKNGAGYRVWRVA